MDKMVLAGKTAIVTGAGGGIGRAIALAMSAAGANVVVNDVGGSLRGLGSSSDPAEETKRLIQDAGGNAAVSLESVSEWASAKRVVETALDCFGGLDIVVNNAGILRDAVFHKMPPEDWLSVIGVHLNGSFFISRAAAEVFRKQESGAYVHMTSTSGLIGTLGQSNYAAAKLGIVALSKGIAIDMRRFNVRSNSVAPVAWSRMTEQIPTANEQERAFLERYKVLTPDKNAPLVVYLASDLAKDVTGQVFHSRYNELFLMSQSRPIRAMQRGGGWTVETIANEFIPAMSSSFMPVDQTEELFTWDPI